VSVSERDKVAHLLRRFGLGASEAEVEFYGTGGLTRAIDRLLNYETVEEGFTVTYDDLVQPDKNVVAMPALVGWWTLRLLQTRRPLQEKMTLFWHDHFATSAEKVKAAGPMFAQNEILRANATGSFRTLLHDVSKDPAMIFWLDNQFNIEGKPNENFAREVMELFTVGIGHYTEKDVQEAARAFTGWGIGARRGNDTPQKVRGAFAFRAGLHDSGTKTIFGKTGDFNGDDVLDMLLAMPQTAKHLVTKIWEWFVYANPEKKLVNRFAAGFAKDYEIKSLLRAIMESPEFYSQKAMRATYKNPVDFVIAAARAMGYGDVIGLAPGSVNIRRGLGQAIALNVAMKNMGLSLFYPPDVSGWNGGSAWISSATMLERMSLADKLFGTSSVARGRLPFTIPVARLVAGKSPSDIVRTLLTVFDAPLPPAKTKTLTDAAIRASREHPDEPRYVGAAVARMIFASPEFQFS
jgi:uncharacterized protein (DUF1800 family)